MNTEVIVSGDVVPPTKIVLELEVDEFAALYALYCSDFDGELITGNVRDRVSRGLNGALNDLADGWREKCGRIRYRGARYLVDAVDREFNHQFDGVPELS